MADAPLERRMLLETHQARYPIVNIASPTGSNFHFVAARTSRNRATKRPNPPLRTIKLGLGAGTDF